jgi:hypothetical protein
MLHWAVYVMLYWSVYIMLYWSVYIMLHWSVYKIKAEILLLFWFINVPLCAFKFPNFNFTFLLPNIINATINRTERQQYNLA